MELQPISQVSKQYGVSAQTLRYYEQIGLVKSIRKDDASYRFYDEETQKRLHFVVLLRKLRISVKQIKQILGDQNALAAVEIFERNISELDEEITSLSTIKSILTQFARELRAKADMVLLPDLLGDVSSLSIIDSISFSKNHINKTKESLSMEDLNKASEQLNKLSDRHIRIIYVPPATVASIHHIGCSAQSEIPESTTGILMREFINSNDLAKIKPDLRHYGFNHPSSKNSEEHGYERWITIPENMDISEPFVKKQFIGGLYAAYMIMGDWDEVPYVWEWVENSEKYALNLGASECMNGCLEEYLIQTDINLSNGNYFYEPWQIDFLIPIKEKK